MKLSGPMESIGFAVPRSWKEEMERQVIKKGCRSLARFIRMAIQEFVDMPKEYIEEGKR